MYIAKLALAAPTVLLFVAALGLPGTACKKQQPAAPTEAPDDVTPLPPPPADPVPDAADAGSPPAAADVAPPPGNAPAVPTADTAEPPAPDTPDAQPPPAAEAAPLTEEEARIVAAAVNGLAGDLHPRLAEGRTNMAFSPTSIALALAMTSGGARSETADQMNAVLHLGDDPDQTRELLAREQRLLVAAGSETVKLAIANRLFGERSYTFVPEFLEWTATQFAAPLEAVDFRGAPEPSRARVNAWVNEQTHERIPEILPTGSIDSDTRLVLANAIWFKGQWLLQFEEQATRPRPFTLAGGSKVEVPMMARTAPLRFANRGGTKLLELPYDGEELSMLVVLPPDDEPPDSWLTAANLEGIGRLPQQEVEVWLPRFKIDPPTPTKLNADLEALGMPRAFERTQAEFEGIGDPPNPVDKLYVSAVFHRAFVEVNEEGTEAAAATAVVMARLGGGIAVDHGPARFHADHPFLFLIRENRTGLVLFVGRVGDPRTTG
ncbi:MAG: serpin family protein [Deltaproteobacteria bacterium]|nr:serpin family protein [Deltaproteobacteria bacterium]